MTGSLLAKQIRLLRSGETTISRLQGRKRGSGRPARNSWVFRCKEADSKPSRAARSQDQGAARELIQAVPDRTAM